MTLLADVNYPGTQKDMVSDWEPANSLVEDAWSLGPRLPLAFLLWLSHTCLSASGVGKGPVHSCLALLWYLLNPLFCEQTRLHVRLEPFTGKVLFLFFSSLLAFAECVYSPIPLHTPPPPDWEPSERGVSSSPRSLIQELTHQRDSTTICCIRTSSSNPHAQQCHS